jgi:hypothetical protein
LYVDPAAREKRQIGEIGSADLDSIPLQRALEPRALVFGYVNVDVVFREPTTAGDLHGRGHIGRHCLRHRRVKVHDVIHRQLRQLLGGRVRERMRRHTPIDALASSSVNVMAGLPVEQNVEFRNAAYNRIGVALVRPFEWCNGVSTDRPRRFAIVFPNGRDAVLSRRHQ